MVSVAGAKLTGVTFGEAIREPGLSFPFAKFDGIRGLRFPSFAVAGVKPIFNEMLDQKIIMEPVFSVYLQKNHEESGGEMTFGGINSTKYIGDLTYIPVSREASWQFTLDSILVNDQENCYDCKAVADIGALFIAGPSDYVEMLQNDINVKKTIEWAVHR